MEYSNFKSLCKTLGDQNLPEEERWKSLKYINIAGQAIPGFDFQRLLKENRITFVASEEVGPGFIIDDTPNSDMGVTNTNDPILSFIPLDSVDSLTFIVTKEAEDGSSHVSLGEILETVTGETYDIPVAIRFENSVYYFIKGEEMKFPVKFSRNITKDNYDVTYQDILGNTLDKAPTEVGSYYAVVTCKNGYIGKNKCRFEIKDK
jgi:hypothetical protein